MGASLSARLDHAFTVMRLVAQADLAH